MTRLNPRGAVLPGLSTEALRVEAAAALGWQAPQQAWLGGWLLRAADGFTGRANSALPLGDPGLPVPEAVHRVERWYAARDRPAMIVVPHPLAGPAGDPLTEFLDRQGWSVRSGASVVMTAPTDRVARTAADRRITLAGEPDADWFALYRYRGAEPPPIAARLLLSAPWQRFASLRIDGATVAVARIAVADGWAGVTAMEVRRDQRRRGLGTAILTALAEAARHQGADRMYLQVEIDNTAALALYRRCGFAESHGYRYRIAPPARVPD